VGDEDLTGNWSGAGTKCGAEIVGMGRAYAGVGTAGGSELGIDEAGALGAEIAYAGGASSSEVVEMTS
jgi:hypothetical protein